MKIELVKEKKDEGYVYYTQANGFVVSTVTLSEPSARIDFDIIKKMALSKPIILDSFEI